MLIVAWGHMKMFLPEERKLSEGKVYILNSHRKRYS